MLFICGEKWFSKTIARESYVDDTTPGSSHDQRDLPWKFYNVFDFIKENLILQLSLTIQRLHAHSRQYVHDRDWQEEKLHGAT